jgi:hypothetical protein
MAQDILEVYWAPAAFSIEQESWNLLYPEPELIKDKLQVINSGFSRGMFACPVTKSNLKNLYSLKSAVDETIDLPKDFLVLTENEEGTFSIPTQNRQVVSLVRQRRSSLKGYSNLLYNLSWIFASEEPLHMEFMSPFIPPFSPSPNAILATGGWDIGKWFRPTSLDYHIPLSNTSFEVNTGDELAYVKFVTDKKVVLKRFIYTTTIKSLSEEMTSASIRYNHKKSLLQRYEMAKNSNIMKVVLKEIKANLVN